MYVLTSIFELLIYWDYSKIINTKHDVNRFSYTAVELLTGSSLSKKVSSFLRAKIKNITTPENSSIKSQTSTQSMENVSFPNEIRKTNLNAMMQNKPRYCQ